MKKIFTLFFLLALSLSFSQKNNTGYDFVIVPDRFDFLSEANEYNLNELSKFLMSKKIPALFNSDQKPIEYNLDECSVLKFNLTKEKSFLNIKLKITLTDCNGKIIAESIGENKEKSYRVAYNHALRDAFDLLYIPNKETFNKLNNIETINFDQIKNPDYLYAEKTVQGFKLSDSEDNEKYILFKTSKNDQFIISNSEINGALYKNKNQDEWTLEYLKDDKVVTETLKIRF